ncbi:MAG: hypothetical protein ABUK01_05545 [Leptospirales bacterium]
MNDDNLKEEDGTLKNIDLTKSISRKDFVKKTGYAVGGLFFGSAFMTYCANDGGGGGGDGGGDSANANPDGTTGFVGGNFGVSTSVEKYSSAAWAATTSLDAGSGFDRGMTGFSMDGEYGFLVGGN